MSGERLGAAGDLGPLGIASPRRQRVQRSRAKGWRTPQNAVYVGRPTRWGNPYRIGDCVDCGWGKHDGPHRPMTAADAVEGYKIVWEALVSVEGGIGRRTPEELRLSGVSGLQVDLFEEIRGKDLACWCPLDQPCHADVLLELANRDRPVPDAASPAIEPTSSPDAPG